MHAQVRCPHYVIKVCVCVCVLCCRRRMRSTVWTNTVITSLDFTVPAAGLTQTQTTRWDTRLSVTWPSTRCVHLSSTCARVPLLNLSVLAGLCPGGGWDDSVCGVWGLATRQGESNNSTPDTPVSCDVTAVMSQSWLQGFSIKVEGSLSVCTWCKMCYRNWICLWINEAV